MYNQYNLEELTLTAGSYTKLTFSIYEQGQPVNLDESTFYFYAKKRNERGTPIELNLTGEREPALGDHVFSVVINSTDTEGLSGKFEYQIKLVDGSGKVFIPGSGIIIFRENLN